MCDTVTYEFMSVEYLGLSSSTKPDIKSIWRKGYKIGNILNYDPLKDRYVLAAFTIDLAINNTFYTFLYIENTLLKLC